MNWETELRKATAASIPLLIFLFLLDLFVKAIEALARRRHNF